ncbi:MAG: DUF4445 domain-containing protein [Dehalococcoidia bacterium]|nr:DUF4445 domain-containing protein [Dehalococcoidia bacterium]
MTYVVYFEPVGRGGQCSGERSILDCARELGVGIVSLCGGQGTCHSCKVRVVTGNVSPPTTAEYEAFAGEELADGWRLACQARPESDCLVTLPPASMTTVQRMQVEGLEVPVQPEPSVRGYRLRIPTPELTAARADADSLIETLNRVYMIDCRSIDYAVLRSLSAKIRAFEWESNISVRGNEVVSVRTSASPELGLAVDLGTTKIAAYLVDLSDGATVASRAVMNPQIQYGEDIISRITAVMRFPERGEQMQSLVVEAINELARELALESGATHEDIVEAVIAGNTAMHHLFLSLPVSQLALSPFVPAASLSMDIKARDIGLQIAPGAYLHMLPNIAGFVGSDHIAMLLATDAWQAKGPVLALDIGTNTEVSLVVDGRISSVSCASGPAFEGFHIKQGMRAASGAIERVRMADDSIQLQTIDDAYPVGICGSGILDAMAELHRTHIIDDGGRMTEGHPRVRSHDDIREFILVEQQERHAGVVITQHDVREVQKAKAAIRSGIEVLLEHEGKTVDDLEEIIIAGAFGTYIDVSSAIDIGMLPPAPEGRFRQVGNAAGMGAKMALISLVKRAEAQDLPSRVKYIELAGVPGFNETYVQSTYLGRYRMKQGKRQEIG